MSFVLPGNVRELRFSGEAKAETAPASEGAGPTTLGKPRERKPPPPVPARARVGPLRGGGAPSFPAARTALPRDVAAAYPPSSGSPAIVHKRQEESYSDGDPTTAMDREGKDLRPLRAPRLPSPLDDGATRDPFAHLRQPMEQPTTVFQRSAQSRGAPYVVWILASVLAGLISYHVAPEILSRVETKSARSSHGD